MSKASTLGKLVSEGKQFVQLDATGKISSLQLPSYVDDVLEYTNLATFPVTGTSGIIYIAQNTNKTYRWSGSAYVEIGGGSGSSSGGTGPASTDELAEGTVNLYHTNTRSRNSLSFSAGGGAYNNTTGVITIPTNTIHLSNGSGYITANQPITLSGDVTGNGTTSIPVTLANSGVTAGSYFKVTVDSKGRVTSGTTLASNDITTALTFTPENVANRAQANGYASLDATGKVPSTQLPVYTGTLTDSQITAALTFTPENSANRAQANGYASLDATGKVPSTQLPSYVDDVVEYANLATFPASGTAGIIYVTQDTNKTYRWTGSAYVEISPSPGTTDSLIEGSTNLYHTTARARSSLSFSTGSGAYNSTTGVITIPTNTTELTNGSGYITGNQTVTLSGDVTGSGSTAITVTLATVGANKGGTGQTSLTTNNIILGNGTSPVQFVAPGSAGNVLTSNGTTWVSSAVGPSLLGQTDSATPFETALGYQAGNVNTGVNNTFVGYQAGLLNSTGTDNVAIGFKALDANTTGIRNIAIGTDALGANGSGQENIAIGRIALGNNTSGFGNVAIGSAALSSNVSGGGNTAVGYGTLNSNTGSNNTAIGSNALFVNTAFDNTAVGYGALDANTTGNRNVAIGVDAFGANVSGAQNVHIGWNANSAATSGNGQTMVGYQPGANTTGDNNTFIGYQAGSSVTTGTNNLILGYGADASSATISNEVTIGNTSITSTRLRGMIHLNAGIFEQANITATGATGTINFDTRNQSVLYYTSNATANWTLNIRGSSIASLDSIMNNGQSLTIAFLVTNGGSAYYQSGFQVDGLNITPKWQGGTAPTTGNVNSVDIYVITILKYNSASFYAFASQTKFA